MPGRMLALLVAAAVLVAASPAVARLAGHRGSGSASAAACADLGQASSFAVFSDGAFTSVGSTSVTGGSPLPAT